MNAQIEILLPGTFDHGFDYLAPEGMNLREGDIVTVPFGRNETLGVVWGPGKANLPAGKMKPVSQPLSQFPPLSAAMRGFVDWASWYNCAAKGAILKMVLPIGDIEKKGRNPHPAQASPSLPSPCQGEGKGEGRFTLAQLSDIQKTAAAKLEEKIGAGFSVTLLDGVTGSGKTEVYFDAMAATLRDEGRGTRDEQSLGPQSSCLIPQVLVLLPEIALSVQWLERFEMRFGFKPVVWNSEITPAKKRAAWQAISKGEARVVIGARSALFLPYKNLSLIIADEEHDGSYKQEEGVIYHARDMAVARARFEKIPVVLVSATPSLESYYNMQQKKYTEVTLAARHNEAVMPDIQMLDMRHETLERGAFVSEPLRKALAQAVADGHQAMLFLNRRGYAPLVLCRACGHRFQCPECSSWMVMHKKGIRDSGLGIRGNLFSSDPRPLTPDPSYLQCHHCDYRIPLPPACPACGAEDKLAACGPGVERLLEEVTAFLPQARTTVMASDSAGGYSEMSDIITAMTEKRIDILIGTQMIAKGHHFSDLAVVGVVDGDLGLSGGDLRASERTYQLLHQLSGRAGREIISGRVYLQSFLPDHPVMKALLSGDRNAFLSAELQARKNAHMPPFSRLAAIIVEGEKEEAVLKTAKSLASSFPAPNPKSPITMYGPAPAPLYMLRGKFRYRLLVKADRAVNLPDFMRSWVNAQETPSSVRVKVDIDPQGFL